MCSKTHAISSSICFTIYVNVTYYNILVKIKHNGKGNKNKVKFIVCQ